VIIEKTSTGFPACSPDLEDCVSTGHTREEVEKNMQEARKFKIQNSKEAVLAKGLSICWDEG
jgi:predicted RNase H-like HicB family nuclease